MTDAEIEKKISAAQTLVSVHKTIDPSTTSLGQALERADAAPDNMQALSTAACYLEAAHDPRTLIYYKRLLQCPLTPEDRMQFLDRYLTCCLQLDAVLQNSEEMERLSSELMSGNPGSISVMGTRGSILIDLGRIDEGKAMLKEVLAKTESLIDKVYSNIFLALAEKQQGNLELARENAARAAKLDPECTALKRVSDLLLT
jgi:tetratricopeptide (TPR) repeat protein